METKYGYMINTVSAVGKRLYNNGFKYPKEKGARVKDKNWSEADRSMTAIWGIIHGIKYPKIINRDIWIVLKYELGTESIVRDMTAKVPHAWIVDWGTAEEMQNLFGDLTGKEYSYFYRVVINDNKNQSLICGFGSVISVGDKNHVSSGKYSIITGGRRNVFSAGDFSTVTARDYCKLKVGNYSVVTGEKNSDVVAGKRSTITVEADSTVIAGTRSTIIIYGPRGVIKPRGRVAIVVSSRGRIYVDKIDKPGEYNVEVVDRKLKITRLSEESDNPEELQETKETENSDNPEELQETKETENSDNSGRLQEVKVANRKLELDVALFDKSVAMQVLYMDERFRHLGGKAFSFLASNGLRIESESSPEISRDAIYLLGDLQDFDAEVSILSFKSNEIRDEWLSYAYEALKEWAVGWKGFKGDSKEIVGFDIKAKAQRWII